MASAPYCNVEVATPNAKPGSPKGFQTIPANASLQQITNIVNNNFKNLISGSYTEDKSQRTAGIVRIFDPNDSSSYVDVRQITRAVWVNSTTGQTIVWQR